MSQLPILTYPDPRLRARARLVESVTPEIDRIVSDMIETMNAHGAIGLAAPQVGVDLRIVTIDVSGKGEAPEVFIDPEVLATRGLAMVEESCLSVPNVSGNVARAPEVRVRSLSRAGERSERTVRDVLAVCLLHEIDHLDGKLFIDRLSLPRRLWAKHRLSSQAR